MPKSRLECPCQEAGVRDVLPRRIGSFDTSAVLSSNIVDSNEVTSLLRRIRRLLRLLCRLTLTRRFVLAQPRRAAPTRRTQGSYTAVLEVDFTHSLTHSFSGSRCVLSMNLCV